MLPNFQIEIYFVPVLTCGRLHRQLVQFIKLVIIIVYNVYIQLKNLYLMLSQDLCGLCVSV